MRILGNTLTALAMVCACVVALVSCVQILAFNEQFYHQQHQKLGTAQHMGMSENDLDAMMKALLGYLRGNRPDIEVQVTVDGEQRPAFDERETQHMVDVLNLYNSAKLVRSLLFIVAMLLLGWALMLVHKEHIGFVWLMRRCALWLGLGTLGIALLMLFAYFNFDTFWTGFHELFFTNDLWMLDPSISLMINMLPSQLFFSLCMRIATGYLGFTAAAIAICMLLGKYTNWRQAKLSAASKRLRSKVRDKHMAGRGGAD